MLFKVQAFEKQADAPLPCCDCSCSYYFGYEYSCHFGQFTSFLLGWQRQDGVRDSSQYTAFGRWIYRGRYSHHLQHDNNSTDVQRTTSHLTIPLDFSSCAS